MHLATAALHHEFADSFLCPFPNSHPKPQASRYRIRCSLKLIWCGFSGRWRSSEYEDESVGSGRAQVRRRVNVYLQGDCRCSSMLIKSTILCVGFRQAKYMLLTEFVIAAVPCELNRLFFLPPKRYVVAKSTKV
jgi:hypothetical protein